ncbi:S-adenosylmethionine synthase isoform type-1 [Brachionus plicatilis]|uniref:methionine adenosyltransferase n=1 Tax=Brachionus plicatilis TaxID=10195 RepID=A0A3M7QJX4_BRAPC|nr:S-adenosylmethionine synthase isoform type-1 [Brachionus plicatilis]
MNHINQANTENDAFLFTSESIGEDHQDKISDQINDSVLDAHLAHNLDTRVTCESSCKIGVGNLNRDIAQNFILTGADDEALMLSHATGETKECMPLTMVLAHKLNKAFGDARRCGLVPWARPDIKTRVTVEYKNIRGNCVPIRIYSVVISTQHSPEVTIEKIRQDLMEHVIKPTIPAHYLDEKTIYHLNPSGFGIVKFGSNQTCF